MRTKILLFLLFAFLFQFGSVKYLHAQTVHTYAEKSVLSKGRWAKIKISGTGIYKLTYDEIRNMGFSNPKDIRIFGFGGAMLDENITNPRIDDLPEIAIYDGGSYVLFYAQGAIKWNSNLNSFNCKFNFTINPYSDFGYYFLTTDAGVGKRIGNEAKETAGADDYLWNVTSFIDYACVKKEEMNFARSGRVWYGDVMASGERRQYSFTFPNIETEKEIRVQVSAVASSSASSELSLDVDYLREKMSFLSVSGHIRAYAGETNLRKYPTSDKIALSFLYSGNDASARAAINYITINAWRKLIMSGNAMFFRNDESIGYDVYSRFTLQNTTANTLIWNVTDPQNIAKVPAEFASGNLQFEKKTEQLLEFAAVNPSGQFPTPEFVGVISNQNLHAFSKNTDFVIISHPDFLSEANRLAQKHREFDQMKVEVVTPEQVYNEFSSGTPDATAYRWLMKMIFDRDTTGSPKYLLLFGDGSYDNKGILTSKAVSGRNFILTFQSYNSIDEEKSYCSDDYFGFMDDFGNLGSASADIGIGRFPVSNLNEAKIAVDKSIAYMENKNKGAWKNRICLVADDNEKYTSPSTFNRFMTNSEEISNIIYKWNPGMEVKKLYSDAFTKVTGANGNRFPELETLLSEEIKSGVKFLNYIGHSGITNWAEERIFTQAQARTLQNKNLGLWFTASCEFTRFDDLSNYSGGEDLFLNPDGGAIAVYSSSRVVFDNYNQQLNRKLAEVLFERDEDGKPLRFGDIHKKSKQTLLNDSNKMTFVMLADPALRFAYPDLTVKTDSILFLSGDKTDTINALSEVRVYGRIEDFFGSGISNFSGRMKIKVYDKETFLFAKTHQFRYKDRPNTLFSGETTVENGVFSFVFKVPKDINYNYGLGRISYYAYDEENGFEAQGAYEDFTIGGSDENAKYETEGPEVTLFLNSEKFGSGDRVNESPVFFAFMKDESGVNTSGAGIGHDITLTLNDSGTPVVLNSYFNFFPDSYTEGSLAYQLENLEPGKYTLTFKAWDLLNNSTTKQIEFEVVKELPVKIEELVAYPNPAQEYVYFRIQHDRPESVLECKVKVYTANGQLVYESENKDFESSNFVTVGWNLSTSSGSLLPAGVYMYRIEMRTSEGRFTGKSQKLIISR